MVNLRRQNEMNEMNEMDKIDNTIHNINILYYMIKDVKLFY